MNSSDSCCSRTFVNKIYRDTQLLPHLCCRSIEFRLIARRELAEVELLRLLEDGSFVIWDLRKFITRFLCPLCRFYLFHLLFLTLLGFLYVNNASVSNIESYEVELVDGSCHRSDKEFLY